jgi:hypothetical protein
LDFYRGKREFGEPFGKILGGLVDMVRRAVVEQVPDDLDPGLLSGFKRRYPARPVIFPRRFLDQVPAKAVAKCPEPELATQPIVAQHVLIVACRPDEIEADAIAPPVRRTFEPSLEEAGERLVHGSHQCANTGIDAGGTRE